MDANDFWAEQTFTPAPAAPAKRPAPKSGQLGLFGRPDDLGTADLFGGDSYGIGEGI
jgi:hypothetical protein